MIMRTDTRTLFSIPLRQKGLQNLLERRKLRSIALTFLGAGSYATVSLFPAFTHLQTRLNYFISSSIQS